MAQMWHDEKSNCIQHCQENQRISLPPSDTKLREWGVEKVKDLGLKCNDSSLQIRNLPPWSMSSLDLQLFREPASPWVQALHASLFLLHATAAHVLELTPLRTAFASIQETKHLLMADYCFCGPKVSLVVRMIFLGLHVMEQQWLKERWQFLPETNPGLLLRAWFPRCSKLPDLEVTALLEFQGGLFWQCHTLAPATLPSGSPFLHCSKSAVVRASVRASEHLLSFPLHP